MPVVSKSTEQAGLQIARMGYTWSSVGVPGMVTYGFRGSAPDYSFDQNDLTRSFERFDAAQKQGALTALALWADVANITFTPVSNPDGYTDNASILFGAFRKPYGAGVSYAFGYYPGGYSAAGDVWINNIDPTAKDMMPGRYGLMTLIHEIGHAIGLAHPGSYDAAQGPATYEHDAEYTEDTRMYSVMSYFDASYTGADHKGFYAQTPLIDDIAAIQHLYGANTATRAGDTVYGFNATADRAAFRISSAANSPIFAVWDAGGTDTFDFSGYATNQRIDLRPESFSNVGNLTRNVSIAAAVVIENAIGGSGGDILIGNGAANGLRGGAGDDRLEGAGGNDRLDGGSGADIMQGGLGDDTYVVDITGDLVLEAANEGHDIVVTALANYELPSGIEELQLMPGAANGTGNQADNRLTGNAEANRLDGGAGADVMAGGLGRDVYLVDNALDQVMEDPGQDSDTVIASVAYALAPGVGVERLQAASQSTVLSLQLTGNDLSQELSGDGGANVLEGEGGNDRVFGWSGQDTLRGDSGNDRLFGGLGNDVLAGGPGRDYFAFDTKLNKRSNVDRILDFNVKDDFLQIENKVFTKVGPAGRLKAGYFWTGSSAHDRDDHLIYNRGSGALYYDPDGLGGSGAVKFAQLSKGLKLSHADILVI